MIYVKLSHILHIITDLSRIFIVDREYFIKLERILPYGTIEICKQNYYYK